MTSPSTRVDLSVHLDQQSFERLDNVIGDLERVATFLSESARERRPLGNDETQVVRTPAVDETSVLRGIGMPEVEPVWVNGYTLYMNDTNDEHWVKDGDLPAPSWRQLFVEKKRRTL